MATESRRHAIKSRDFAEIIIGSVVLAFPVAVTEEVWVTSANISLLRVLLIALGSMFFISFFVRTVYFNETTWTSSRQVAGRTLTVYSVTLLTAALTLFAVDKLPLAADALVSFKRTVIVAFPASFAATVVDSIGD